MGARGVAAGGWAPTPEALRLFSEATRRRIHLERRLRQSHMRPHRVVRYLQGQPSPGQLKAIDELDRGHFGKLEGGAEIVMKTAGGRVVAVSKVAPQRTVARPANTSRPRGHRPRSRRAPSARKARAPSSDDPHESDLAIGARL
jgi:hypothetical protein